MNKFLIILIYLFYINFSLQSECVDVKFLRSIYQERNQNLDEIMKFSSNSVFIVLPTIPVSLFVYFLINDKKEDYYNSVEIAGSIVISGVSSLILKQIFKRERPFNTYKFVENIGGESGYSFPSSHSTTSFALATSLSLLYPEWYVIIPSYLWASIVSYSRMHLGVHYFSDVLVGAILGTSFSIITHQLMKEIKR